jgi:hypothetical protein
LLGTTTETVRKWVRQAKIDVGSRPGVTTEESAELKRLEPSWRTLSPSATLKAASAFYAAELDRPSHRSFDSSVSIRAAATAAVCGGVCRVDLRRTGRARRSARIQRTRHDIARVTDTAAVQDLAGTGVCSNPVRNLVGRNVLKRPAAPQRNGASGIQQVIPLLSAWIITVDNATVEDEFDAGTYVDGN